MEEIQKEIKLTQMQLRALRPLIGGGMAYRDGSAVLINEAKICSLPTIEAMQRKGVVNKVIERGQHIGWVISLKGSQLANVLFR